MKTVTFKLTNDQARIYAWYLRKRYGRDKRTSLNRLAKIALFQEIVAQIDAEKEELYTD